MASHSADPYFEKIGERQTLLWSMAVRRQLERWEPLVAKHAMSVLEPNLKPRPMPPTVMEPADYWQGEVEHHVLLVTANNLLKALQLLDRPPKVAGRISADLRDTRDLLEHWEGNMPIFNVHPRATTPKYKSGQNFVTNNPNDGPYCWWRWNTSKGPLVSPQVAATEVHALVDSAVKVALKARPDMADFVTSPAPRPWHVPATSSDWWWPNL